MWSWWGHGDVRIIVGSTITLLVLVVVVGRYRRRRTAEADWAAVSDDETPVWRQPALVGSVLRWLMLATLVAGGAGAGLLWLFGWPKLPSVSAFDTGQVLDLLKIALAVVAGLGGVVVLTVNLRKQRVTEAEHGLAQARDEREQAQSFNERFGTAAEQLAHENPAVRLAGVYAMAGLADDWVSNRQICVDVLCGYLRLPSGERDSGDEKVRQTLLRVLHQRLAGEWGKRTERLDLDLTGGRFTDLDFTLFRRVGRLSLDKAEIHGERATFGPMADEVGYAGAVVRVDESWFERACRVDDTEFSGGRLVFDSTFAEFQSFEFFGCRFEGVTIVVSGPQSLHDRIRFDGCGFVGCTFEFDGLVARSPTIEGLRSLMTVENSVLTDCVFDLRGAVQAEHVLWVIGSELESVRFTEEHDVEPVKILNASGLKLTDTVLPERHVRIRERT